MTTLRDIFQDLSYGELQGTALGNLIAADNESEPDPKSYKQLTSHVNAALRKLYTRFMLSAKELYIDQNEAIETYYLLDKYAAQSGSAEPVKYISDSVANPFDQTELLKIEQCFDEEGGLLKLNDFSDELSLFTPAYNAIQMPWPNEFNTVAVQYRANHPRIIYTTGDDIALVEVAVPEVLYEALMLYIAYRGLPRMDDGAQKQQMLQAYEMSCQQVEKAGLHPQAEPGDWRFDAKGWV
jgi:hypothetical protein